jgi:predicted alpha/beta superfamily hydrolase
MKSLYFSFFFSVTFLSATAQQNNVVTTGSVDSIYSPILKEQRKFWVHLPPDVINGLHPNQKYPVVYLLDGENNFNSVVGMIDLLSAVNGNSFFPQMIVVGILNTDRFRDLTPTHVTMGLWVDSARGKGSGGGERFIEFIEKELMPHINSSYPAGRYRMMIGHSLGGLMAIHTLIHHKELFNSYVAIDPSMWWDRQKLLQETAKALQATSYAGTAVFLGMANTLPYGMDTVTVQQDSSEGSIHPRSILQLTKYIMAGRQNGLKANYRYYNDDTHSSVPLIATYDALHFIFKDYQLQLPDNYFADTTFKLDSFLTAHYANITSEYGITSGDGRTLLPPEDVVINTGFQCLDRKQFKRAEDLYKLNIKNYPLSPLTYTFLGDVYAAKGEKGNAKASYKKSLSLKETTETRKKLEKLEGK